MRDSRLDQSHTPFQQPYLQLRPPTAETEIGLIGMRTTFKRIRTKL